MQTHHTTKTNSKVKGVKLTYSQNSDQEILLYSLPEV